MSREKLLVRGDLRRLPDGRIAVPFARIMREDGQPRTHHPRCPSHPGEPLHWAAVCCDCIYGALCRCAEGGPGGYDGPQQDCPVHGDER